MRNFTPQVLVNFLQSIIGKRSRSRKAYILGLSLVCLCLSATGQVATNYTYSASNGTYTPLAASTTVFPAGWCSLVANVPLPFVFYFNGKGYSNIWVSSNGFVTFGANSPLASNNNPIGQNDGFDGSVSGFGLNGSGYSGAIVDAQNANPVVYGTQISGGNTVFVLQWTNAERIPIRPAGGGALDVITFQIRLVQNTNVVEVSYGACTSNYGFLYANIWSPVVGLGGSTTTDFNDLQSSSDTWTIGGITAGTSSSSFVQFNDVSTTAIIPSGLTFDWTPSGAIAPVACSGTPTSPIAVASAGTTCGSFSLGLAGLPNATGLTYQWNTSNTGLAGSWTAISGATTASYSVTPAAAAYYGCRVSCGASSVFATPVAVGHESTCPTVPLNWYSDLYNVNYAGNGLTIADFNIPAGANTCGSSFIDASASASGYGQYNTGVNGANYVDLTYLKPIKLQVGTTYAGGTITAGYTNAMNAAVWIDFNDDGLFTGAGEEVATVTAFTNTSTGNLSIAIPAVGAGAYYGLHRMRVRACEGTAFGGPAAAAISPTAAYVTIGGAGRHYGITKDYLVDIQPPNQIITASPIVPPAYICAPGAVETLTATTNINTGTATGDIYTYTWSGPSGYGTSASTTANTTTFSPTTTAYSGVYSVMPVSDGAQACAATTIDITVATSVSAPTAPPLSGLTISGNTWQGASNITFTPFTTAPNGYLIIATNSSTPPTNPTNGTTYATGAAGLFGAGSVVISGSVYANAPPYSTTALNSNSLYYIYVYPFNIDCTGPKYYDGYPTLIGNTLTTCIAPPTGLTATVPTGSSVNLSWTAAVNGGNPATVIAPATFTYVVNAYVDAGLTTEAIGYPINIGSGTTYTAGGLGEGTTYYFTVTSTAIGAACGTASNVAGPQV